MNLRKLTALFFISVLACAPASAFFFVSSGPLFPTAATGNTNTIGGGAAAAWTNPQNIEIADGVFTTVVPGGATTQDLRGGTFGFSIPSTAIVKGILLEVSGETPTTTGLAFYKTVEFEGGGTATANRGGSIFTLTSSNVVTSFGGSSDLWGTTWTPAQINSPSFFTANVSIGNTGIPGTVEVDFFRVTVTFINGQSQFLQLFSRDKKPQVQSQTRMGGF